MNNHTSSLDKGLLDTFKFKSFSKTTSFKKYSMSYTKVVRKTYSSRKFLSTYYPLSIISLAWINLYSKLRLKASNLQSMGLLSSTSSSFSSMSALTKLRMSFNMFHDSKHSYMMTYTTSSLNVVPSKLPQSTLSYYESNMKGFNHQLDLHTNTKLGNSFVMTKNYVLTLRSMYVTLLLQHVV